MFIITSSDEFIMSLLVTGLIIFVCGLIGGLILEGIASIFMVFTKKNMFESLEKSPPGYLQPGVHLQNNDKIYSLYLNNWMIREFKILRENPKPIWILRYFSKILILIGIPVIIVGLFVK